MRTEVFAAPEPEPHAGMCAWQWCHRGGVRCASAAHSSRGILADERMPSPRSALREQNRQETPLSPDGQLLRIWPPFGSVGSSVWAVNASWFFFSCECCWAPNRCRGAHRPAREHVQWERRKCCTKVSTGKVVTALEVGLLSRLLPSLDQLVKQRDNLPSPAAGNNQ